MKNVLDCIIRALLMLWELPQNIIGAFLFVLLGIILNWKGAWEPRTSVGWELVDTLGERTYRFWKGVFMAILIIILVVIYCTTY